MAFIPLNKQIEIEKQYYLLSTDEGELGSSLTRLQQISHNPYLSEENKKLCTLYLLFMGLKLHGVSYFATFSDNAYRALLFYMEKAAPIAEKEGILPFAEVASRLRRTADAAYELMKGLSLEERRLFDEGGALVASSVEVCHEVAKSFRHRLTLAESFPAEPVFSQAVKFPSPKEKVTAYLTAMAERAEWAAETFAREQTESLLRGVSENLTGTLSAEQEYYPAQIDNYARTGVLVLYTPFIEEGLLVAHKHTKGAPLLRLLPEHLSTLNDTALRRLFGTLAERGIHAVVENLSRYHHENRPRLLYHLFKAGMDGACFYLIDNLPGASEAEGTGEKGSGRGIFEALRELALSNKELDSAHISFLYLTMPDFAGVASLLLGEGMIPSGPAGKEELKAFPFMGFYGLNLAIATYAKEPSLWRDTLAALNRKRRPLANDYLSHLFRPSLLIDEDWGDFGEEQLPDRKKRPFDYDDIRSVDLSFLKKIVEGPFNLFERCGLVARYCITAGDDAELWPTLPLEEKSFRLTTASKCVMKLLGVSIDPIVEVVKKIPDRPNAGGLCINGGQKILYREDCAKNTKWAIEAVCHECFHGFQHMALKAPYETWFFDELGVTRGRVKRWSHNNTIYVDIEKDHDTYEIQIFEGDAYAFEDDCYRAQMGAWPRLQSL